MDKSHEVAEDRFFDEWFGDDRWRMVVFPNKLKFTVKKGVARLVRDDDPESKVGDRILWWMFDEPSGEIRVMFPQNDLQLPGEGLWLKKHYRLTDDGHIAPSGYVELRDFSRADPLTSDLQSALGLRGINKQIERHLRIVARRLELGDEWERAAVDVRRPGRKGMSDIELTQWAERYVEALAEDPRRPYAALADRYPGWSDSGLKSIVRRARKAGLLTEVKQGQTGGELTETARRILTEGTL